MKLCLNGVDNDLNIDDIPKVNLNLLKEKGIWIEENSREYVVDLFNALTNKRYKTDNKGFLVKDIENPKKIEEQNNELNFYTEKIEELMNSQKLIIINITDKYKQLNEIDKDIINIKIEEDDYALLFKENAKIENSNDIILLNAEIYNKDNNTNTIAFLLNKILELYYNEDEAFSKVKENNDFIDSSGTFSKIFDEKLERVENKQSDESEDKINENLIDENTADENTENNNVIDKQVIGNDMTNSNVMNNQIIENNEDNVKNNIFDDSITEEEFNLLVAGILSDEVNNNNLSDILKAKPEKNGIWIEKNSREKFLAFLNKHTIYTYSVDEEGYLLCDNIMKDNPELDMYEKMETEVDIEIKNILKKNVLIIIDLNNNYYIYDENNNIMATQLQSEDFLKSFSFDSQRVIVLNNEYYSKAEFNLALSDYLVKALDNVQEKVITGELTFNKQPLTRSDTSKPGNMLSAQTVYAGPSNSNYATVGSVSSGEMVYLLGQQAGWYHIQYMVTGTSQQKSGFVPVSTVNNNGNSVHEEQMTGGQNFANATVNIMSCDDTDIDVSLGTVYEGEGMTVLYTYGYSDSNKSYNIAYVEISTPSGTKRGYIPSSYLAGINYPSSVARITDTNSAYSGPDNGYVKLGGAYYNEFVTILAKNTGNNWVWVEYNTPDGRKRGFMDYAKMVNYNHPGMYNDLPINNGLRQATQQLTVYGGPSTNAANIGLIYNQEIVTLYNTERNFAYIEYSTSGGAKRGYVDLSKLAAANPPSIPNIQAYGFKPGTYGTSGLGKELKYYQLGDGINVAFVVFEQHGWEDEWAYDGIELINIAQRVMQNLSSTGISNNWTLYIIPYANPDGITNGYTNNGPGRCTVTTSIDMNRCWPANFTPFYNTRNYTGGSPLGAIEAQQLKNFIEAYEGNAKKIVLDIHGWLNQTYGDSEVASYFTSQFGFKHSSTYGSGYLETWGKSIGAQSCLVELPKPSSSADILNRDYSGKVANAIRNMLNGISGGTPVEGGIDVNETVRVIAQGSLNVREGPGTNYSIIASLQEGSIVTRIKRNVASANGYTWDKIKLDNGNVGYVATNYLHLVVIPVTVTGEYNGDSATFSSSMNISDIPIVEEESTEIVKSEQEAGKRIYESNLTSHIIDDVTLLEIKTLIYGGAATLAVFDSDLKDSGENMLYYLTMGEEGRVNGEEYSYTVLPYTSGHRRREFIGLNLLSESNQGYNNMLDEIGKAMNAAEKYTIDGNNSATFVRTNEQVVRQSQKNNDSLNWQTALGDYRTFTRSTVTKSGDSYTMNVEFHIEDYYDWREEDENFALLALVARAYTEGILDTIFVTASCPLWQMNIVGMARNYTNYDTINLKVTWTKGQDVRNGAKVVFN